MVSGKVTYPDGKPVPRGQVTFNSGSFTAGGHILDDGTYNIGMRVPAGTYQVTVIALGESPIGVDPEDAKPAKPLVDAKYNNPATSGLECVVSGTTVFNIEVEAPK